MAWTIETYAGTRMGGVPSNARTAMFELCRAVNERQRALGITKTAFRKADDTTGADLTTDDLAQIKCAGTNSNAFRNLKSIRDAIISMVNAGYFLETSGGTEWTKANLETDIGTDLDADPIRPQEARYWQAMKDALDRLIYCRADLESGTNSANNSVNSSHSDQELTIEEAWDGRFTNSGVAAGNISGPYAAWYKHPISDFRVSIRNPYEDTPFNWVSSSTPVQLYGDVVSAEVVYDTYLTSAAIVGSVNATLSGESIVISGTSTGNTQSIALSLASPVTIDFSIDDNPSSSPFNTNTLDGGSIGLSPKSMNIDFDIAAELTDQA